MQKIAIFPGSFDPFTVGHQDIVLRALSLFDKVIIAIGSNSDKKGFFEIDKRKQWIENTFIDEPKVEVDVYSGLTIEYCKNKNAKYLLRGLRTSSDFEYERAIAQMNKKMDASVESVFLLTSPELTAVSSTIVRDIIRHGGDAKDFLPEAIYNQIL
ncbi:MAG: pantetheine-phosphate adenylyltransferase [Bacteroidales bacterium]|nr:pantetheine-phosphate adenylyltransferase [Bacteroidales bacterium]